MESEKMKIEIPAHLKMSRKEEQQTSKKLNTFARGMIKSFLSGLFFFITIPLFIFKKIKLRRTKNV